MKNQYWPTEWKKSVVFPILKPGKNDTFPENQRPISVLSMLSEMAEK